MADFQFQLSPGALQGVKAFGGGFPPAGYYAGKVIAIEATDKPSSGKMVIPVDGHEVWEWLNTAVPNPGNDPEIDRKNKNAEKKIRSILESIGYGGAQIDAGPVSHAWIVNQVVYFAYVPPVQGVQDSYAQVDFLTKDKWEAQKASGQAPARRDRAAGNAGGAAPQGFSAPPGVPAAGQGFAAPPAAAQGFAAPAGFAAPPAAAPTVPGPVNGGFAAPPAMGAGFAAPPPVAR